MWGEDFAINFAAHCDEAGLSYKAGIELAEDISEQLLSYAEDRYEDESDAQG